MPKLESLNGNTVMHEEGTLEIDGAKFASAISNESLGTNMVITSGTMFYNKLVNNKENSLEGFKFCINDNPEAINLSLCSSDYKYSLAPGSETHGILCNFNGVEVGIQISVWEEHKYKLQKIEKVILEALRDAE